MATTAQAICLAGRVTSVTRASDDRFRADIVGIVTVLDS